MWDIISNNMLAAGHDPPSRVTVELRKVQDGVENEGLRPWGVQ